MENKCDTQTGCCETKDSSCGPKEECCPVETAIKCWDSAFCEAMREVQVDILKAKIKGAWGPMMEKVADAVIESMGTKWHSMLATGKAQVDLREKIVKIWSEKR